MKLFLYIFVFLSFISSKNSKNKNVKKISVTENSLSDFDSNIVQISDSEINVNFRGSNRGTTSLSTSSITSNLDNISIQNYDDGFVDLENLTTVTIDVASLSSSEIVQIKIDNDGWSSLPSNYYGRKNSTDGDVYIMLDQNTSNITLSISFTNYAFLPNTNETVAQTDDNGTHTFDINARILFDWTADVPGTYRFSFTITSTIE